ncbi:MAG TPA: PspC domain-containing protein [Solirubrobacterales bacterium]|nr:PspC domain-containing protein [Solirubrobacterales bacterium]
MSADSTLRRDPGNAMIAGVCAGIARRLGVDPIVLRVGFVVVAIGTSGIGALAYLALWAVMPAETRERGPRRRRRRGSWRIATGVGLLALSVLLVFRQLDVWWSDALVWPLVLAAFGVALLLSLTRAAPEDVREAATEEDRRRRRSREAAGRLSLAGFGIALVLGAGLLFLWARGVLDAAGDVALAALVVILGLGLILAPLWWRFARSLAAERAQRIRSQERAEVAAHLHDSVLQTLALVQRRADDPADVAKLARRQERELRAWLAGAPPLAPGERLADALRATAVEIEETRGTPIEVVVVGDCPLDERLEALVAATREALTNAAKFAADGGAIRLYAEIDEERVKAFVDDRGEGFDLEEVPPDRRGLRESIVGRIERQGGQAEVRSEPGRGTEVELTIARNSR